MGSKLVRDNYFYEVLAERLSVSDGQDESAKDRGERLEQFAVEAFEKVTGKIVEQMGFCQHDEHELIGCSPDGLIKNKGKYTEAVEIKCLSSANHLKACLEGRVPIDYFPQVVQYFIVNDDLKTLYFILYDPRVTIKPMFVIEVKRKDIENFIEEYKQKELEFLKEVNAKMAEIIEL